MDDDSPADMCPLSESNKLSIGNSCNEADKLLPDMNELWRVSVATRAEVEPGVMGPRALGEAISRRAPNQTSFVLSLVFMRSNSWDINECVRSLTECKRDPPRALQYVSATRNEPPFVACVS